MMRVAAGRSAVPVAGRSPVPTARAFLVVFLHGLRSQRRAPWAWGGTLGAMCAAMAALWPTIDGSVGRLVDAYPERLRAAFWIVRLDSVERYVDAEMLSLVVPLACAVLAVRCVTGPTVGAEERGRLDSLLGLPVTRRAWTWAAFATAGVIVAGTLAIVWAATCAVGWVVGADPSAVALGRGFANVWPLSMVFAGCAVVGAGGLRGSGRVTGVVGGVLLAMYVVDLADRVAPDAGVPGVVSAFHYYGSAIQDGLDGSHLLVLVAGAVVLAAVGGELFVRRDLG